MTMVRTPEYEIRHRPAYSLLEMHLGTGDAIVAEAGALVYMSSNIEVATRMRKGKGLLGSLKTTILGGESFFVNEYSAAGGPAKIGFAAGPVGDIVKLDLNGDDGIVVQRDGYLASSVTVDLDTEWQGFTKGIFGQNLFMLKATGQGDVFVNSFGAIDRHKLGDGETLIVDNFHLVAFTDTCDYDVRKFGSLKSTILGGEGLVTEVRGPGDVYVQTKNLQEFVNSLVPFLPSRGH